MIRVTAALPFLALLVTLGCVQDTTVPRVEDMSTPADPRFLTTSLDAIGVTISGPTQVNAVGHYTYDATVSGGTGPYYYYWQTRECYVTDPDTGAVTCTPEFQTFAEGWDVSSIALYLVEGTRVAIRLELRESPATYATGVARLSVRGPRFELAATPDPYKCRRGLWYPFTDSNGNNYQRDTCTGDRVYAPKN